MKATVVGLISSRTTELMMTFTFNEEDTRTLYYALAHAEMMWRKRSHTPNIDNYGSYADTPEEFEAECRAEMRKLRVMQKELELQLPSGFWDSDLEDAS